MSHRDGTSFLCARVAVSLSELVSLLQGHALMVGEERKMAAHAAPCQAVGVSFIPLVVEILGGWSERARCSGCYSM